MQLKNIVPICVLAFLPFLLQAKEFVLNGTIHVKNGNTFPYHLVCNIKGTQITGYSTTKLRNGAQPKTPIKGIINQKTQILTFTEYPNDTGGQDAITCFVHASVSFRLINNKYQIKGIFKGKDHFDVYCGEGRINFSAPATINEILGMPHQSAGEHTQKNAEGNEQSMQSSSSGLHPSQVINDLSQSGIHAKQPHPKKHTHIVDTTQHHEHGKEYAITSGTTRQFHWYSDTCILDIYDGGVIDGDIVSVLFNADEILTKHTLTKQKHQIKLYVKGKVNTISIIAENLGKTPPNTANFILTDGTRHYKIKAFNDIGESAEIMLKKIDL